MAGEGESLELTFAWSVEDKNEAEAARDDVVRGGGRAVVAEPPDGVAPILIPFIIYGVVTLGFFAKNVYDWWSHRNDKGLLLQVAPSGEVTVKEIAIPYGQILVVDKEGKVTTYRSGSLDEMKAIMTAATTGVTDAVKGLAQSVGGSVPAGV
jgi:hypothetical protein